MLKMKDKQYIRELVDTSDPDEVAAYNEYQKYLTDQLIFAIGEDNEAPDFFLEVLTPDEARRQELIDELIKYAKSR